MKLELTAEQQNYKDQFRDFADEYVMPYAGQNDREERIPEELIGEVAMKGLLGALIPREYDGLELDMVTIGILNEEIGRACSAVRSLLTVHGMVSLGMLRWGTPEQRDYWLPKLASGKKIGAFALTEPNVGSDAKSMEATAERVGDQYVLNAHKKWITMGQIADVFLVMARCEGKPTAFLVERNTPGFSVKPMSGLLGTRGSMLAELTLENCAIPAASLVGQVGTGWSHIGLTCLDYGRYSIACGCVGLAQGCLESSVAYSRQRKQFGEPLRSNQLIQKMVTEMVVNIQAARLLCLEAGHLKDVGDPDSIMKTWVAKYFASTMLTKIAGDAIQIHGANGCSPAYPVERYFRDAKINEIVEGTSQMHEVLIANHAFKTM
ncbi:MAG TPA: acyl-CoA dehydrogenase family protein [Symbiobacteriaceae bacterium]|jgi:hypothetical protein